MKKNNLLNFLTIMMVMMLSFCFISCGGGDDEKENTESNQPIPPSTTVSDPIGTISLSMRNEINGNTKFGKIYINSGNNFAGVYFTSLGTMKGLGEVSKIPTVGWASQVAVKPSTGYVAFSDGSFTRIYVEDYVLSSSGDVIGANIKYQEPFKGADEEIILSDDNIEFKFNESSSKNISINNTSIIALKAESDQSWCKVAVNYFSDNGEVVNISCDENPSEIAREATITLSTIYNKQKAIKVNQLGWEKVGSGTKDDPYNVKTALNFIKSLKDNIESSYDIYINGKIVSISREYNPQYGKATFEIADDYNGERFSVNSINYLGNRQFFSSDKQIKVGDDVVICGKVVYYWGQTPGTVSNNAYLYSLNGYIPVKRWIYGENPVTEPPFQPGAWEAAAMRFSSLEGQHFPTISDDVYFGLKTLIFDVSDVTADIDLKVMNAWWSNTYYDHIKWVSGLNDIPITETMAKECAKGGEGRDLDLMLYSGSCTINSVYYEE